jgi:hypothetical protein
MTMHAGKAVGRRVGGRQASRGQALVASVTGGFVTASPMYRWLRSGERDE